MKELKPILASLLIVPDSAAVGDVQAKGDKPPQWEDARAAVLSLPDSIEGSGSHNALLQACCEVMRWGLVNKHGTAIVKEYNETKSFHSDGQTQYLWTKDELLHKWNDAKKKTELEIGKRLHESTPSETADEFDAIPVEDNGRQESITSAQQHEPITATKVSAVAEMNSRPTGWPDQLPAICFDNPIGEFVLANDAHTEADPAAVLLTLWELFGNFLGRGARTYIGSSVQFCNNYLIILGESALARKGTSFSDALQSFMFGDLEYFAMNRIMRGVSTGEGIIEKVKDLPGDARDERGIEIVQDKRLLILVSEFSRFISCSRREGNTLSATFRDAWDGITLSTPTKTNPMTASNSLISCVSHVTIHEFLELVKQVDIKGGLLNRAKFCLARRSKILPSPPRVDAMHTIKLASAMEAAKAWLDEGVCAARELKWDAKAKRRYDDFYMSDECNTETKSNADELVVRGPVHITREAMKHAVLDKSDCMTIKHFESALAIFRFCRASATYLFGAVNNSDAYTLLDAIKETMPKGLTRTQVSAVFSRNKNREELTRLLAYLEMEQLAHGKIINAGKSKVERWFTGPARM